MAKSPADEEARGAAKRAAAGKRGGSGSGAGGPAPPGSGTGGAAGGVNGRGAPGPGRGAEPIRAGAPRAAVSW
jgi:hypothetical protein